MDHIFSLPLPICLLIGVFRSFRPFLIFYKFLSQALLYLMNFDMLSFHFQLVQCIFKISFETFSLMHGLFRHMLFSFQVFGDFLVIFLFLISGLISLWLENTVYMISILLKKTRLCFMTQDVVYLSICCVGT